MKKRPSAAHVLAAPEHRHSHFTIQAPHFSQAPLSRTLDHLDHIASAHARDTFEELVDAIIAREVVPLSPFDHVEIVDHALTAVQVRVIAGEEQGHVGWVPSAWLHAVAASEVADHPITGRAA